MQEETKNREEETFQRKMPLFRGAATALVTPFRPGKKNETVPDLEALEGLLEEQIRGQTAAVVLAGTTGEGATLSRKEKKQILSHAVAFVGGRMAVIAGSGSNDTAMAALLTADAEACGADGALVVTPYYNKASEEGILSHYAAIGEKSRLPLIVYHVPSRTGLTLSERTVSRLLTLPTVAGFKEAGEDFSRTLSFLSLFHEEKERAKEQGEEIFPRFYSGNDDRTLPILALGGDGVISVTGNLLPSAISALCQAGLSGEVAKAEKLHRQLLPLHRGLFSAVNPIPVKYLLARQGKIRPLYRLPLCPPSSEEKQVLDRLYDRYLT